MRPAQLDLFEDIPTDERDRLLRLLLEVLPVGRKRARDARDLAADLGLPAGRTAEKLRALVRWSVMEREALICSCVDGFFKPANRRELDAYLSNLRHREGGLRRRRAALERAWKASDPLA